MFRTMMANLGAAALRPVPGSASGGAPRPHRRSWTWYKMMHVAFAPEKREKALEIVTERFVPAAQRAGIRKAWFLVNENGEWDLTCILPIGEGPSYRKSHIAPAPVHFWEALIELEGGRERAAALFDAYLEMVEREEHRLVRDYDSISRGDPS